MREAGLLAPTRVGRRRGPRSHDGTITTERPDEMWGTDATACLTTREGNATVFIAVDHSWPGRASFGVTTLGLVTVKLGIATVLLWVETFETVEQLRLALLAFKDRYNQAWLVERHGHRTPAAVRQALLPSTGAAA